MMAARSAARAEAGEAAKAGAARKGGQLEAAEDSEFASLRGYQAGAKSPSRALAVAPLPQAGAHGAAADASEAGAAREAGAVRARRRGGRSARRLSCRTARRCAQQLCCLVAGRAKGGGQCASFQRRALA